MSRAIPTAIPAQVRAGETLTFKLTLADYPATDGWSLAYSFRALNGSKIDFTSAASGGSHLVEVPFGDTAQWVGGISYTGYAVATNGSQTFQIWQGVLNVLPDIIDADEGRDFHTQARRTLDNINAVIEGRAGSTILNSIVEGTQLQRIPASELLLLRDRYTAIVKQEEAAERTSQGLPNRRNIYTRFGRPTR